MDPRSREEAEAEERALGVLEHNLQVKHDKPPVILSDDAARNALTEWRPLAEAAEKSHQAEIGGGRRRRKRDYTSKRRWKMLWVIPMLLVWAAAGAAIFWLLNNGQV